MFIETDTQTLRFEQQITEITERNGPCSRRREAGRTGSLSRSATGTVCMRKYSPGFRKSLSSLRNRTTQSKTAAESESERLINNAVR